MQTVHSEEQVRKESQDLVDAACVAAEKEEQQQGKSSAVPREVNAARRRHRSFKVVQKAVQNVSSDWRRALRRLPRTTSSCKPTCGQLAVLEVIRGLRIKRATHKRLLQWSIDDPSLTQVERTAAMKELDSVTDELKGLRSAGVSFLAASRKGNAALPQAALSPDDVNESETD